MARKGSQKVKTGCFTCKTRKVKCDETKPHCVRCTSTGRKCDGYSPPPRGVFSWVELLGKKPILPALSGRRNTQEGRALDFYHRVVAPYFSFFPGDDFWTRLVAQASHQEPAVRHAVIAISCIYEQIGDTPRDLLLVSPKGRYAMGHYNQALQQLTKTRDEAVVLFVCILFVCIEALRENREAVVAHAQHGIMIYNNCKNGNSVWARDYLLPMFVRLSALPFFFSPPVQIVAPLIGTNAEILSGGPHTNISLARTRLDVIIAHSLRFIYATTVCPPSPLDPESVCRAQQEKFRLCAMMDDWLFYFAVLKTARPLANESLTLALMVETRALAMKITVAVIFEPSEMVYDQYLDIFQEIVRMAELVMATEQQNNNHKFDPSSRPKFIFDMGFLPSLYYVVCRCRNAPTRLAALHYMAVLCPDRESLWNSMLMYSIGRRVIEIEHAGMADAADACQVSPPPEEMRVRHAIISTREPEIRTEGGPPHRKVDFLVGPEEATVVMEEWLELSPAATLAAPMIQGPFNMCTLIRGEPVHEGHDIPNTQDMYVLE